MTDFHTFSHPTYDLGGKTNYRLPPRLLRPVISALICSIKGHKFDSWGNADPKWHDVGHYRTCARCALRRFQMISSKEEFDRMLRAEEDRVKRYLTMEHTCPTT